MTYAPTIPPTIGPNRDVYAVGDVVGRDAGSAIAIAEAINAIPGLGVQRFFHAFDTSRFDSLSAIGSWSPSIGSGAATQAVSGNKPAWSANAINGNPGVSCATDVRLLATSAIDLSAFRSIALTFVGVSTNSSIHVPLAFGATDNGGCMVVAREAANRMEGQGRTGGVSAISRASAAPYTSASVITVTVDYDLTTQCVRVRKNGADVTTSFDVDADLSAGSPGNLALNICNRAAADLGIVGAIGAVMLNAWASAVPTSALTLGEQELMRRWGIT